MKKDESVKNALDSKKLKFHKNETTYAKMEEILDKTPTELTRAPDEPLWISKIDLEYAYCQLRLLLSEETKQGNPATLR